MRHVACFYYMTLSLNRKLVNRVKLCLVNVFPDVVKNFPKIRNLPKFFLRSFENVAHAIITTGNFTCENTIGEFLLFYTFNLVS